MSETDERDMFLDRARSLLNHYDKLVAEARAAKLAKNSEKEK